MAGADSMTIEEVLKQVLLDEHADVIRDAVTAVAREMMELEISSCSEPNAASAARRTG